MLLPLGSDIPQVAEGVYIAPTAAVVGRVSVGSGSSLWFSVVVRGDMNRIQIGDRTNVQDNTVIHVSTERDVQIGDDVTIGHSCVIHGALVGNRAFIGIGSTLLDGAVINDGAVVAARSLVAAGTVVNAGWLWKGVPARPVRPIEPHEQITFEKTASRYVELGRSYLSESVD